ncbi:MAG: hypothetical protein HMLKMBBP_03391 [Planctomycetes bacterium]|nr:hypothetical protein [Planctomycetota bacterium]
MSDAERLAEPGLELVQSAPHGPLAAAEVARDVGLRPPGQAELHHPALLLVEVVHHPRERFVERRELIGRGPGVGRVGDLGVRCGGPDFVMDAALPAQMESPAVPHLRERDRDEEAPRPPGIAQLELAAPCAAEERAACGLDDGFRAEPAAELRVDRPLRDALQRGSVAVHEPPERARIADAQAGHEVRPAVVFACVAASGILASVGVHAPRVPRSCGQARISHEGLRENGIQRCDCLHGTSISYGDPRSSTRRRSVLAEIRGMRCKEETAERLRQVGQGLRRSSAPAGSARREPS